MARKAAQPPQPPPTLTEPRAQVEAELDDRIAAGHELLKQAQSLTPYTPAEAIKKIADEYHTWDEYNRRLLKARFTTEEVANEYMPAMYVGGAFSTTAQELRARIDEISRSLRKLRSVRDQLPLYPEPSAASQSSSAGAVAKGKPTTIFVVHGHNELRKTEVSTFLRMVTPLEVVVLHEKPNAGRTIIEKFEAYAATAAFAVVLLTGDDVGGPAEVGGQKRRARQNVVFELGFFFGALGRSRVVVLYEEEVERPSDVDGLLYVPLDAKRSWRFELAKELKAAQIEVDLNKAL